MVFECPEGAENTVFMLCGLITQIATFRVNTIGMRTMKDNLDWYPLQLKIKLKIKFLAAPEMGGKESRSVPFHPPVGRSGDVPDSSPSRAPAPPAMAPAPRVGRRGHSSSVCVSLRHVSDVCDDDDGLCDWGMLPWMALLDYIYTRKCSFLFLFRIIFYLRT